MYVRTYVRAYVCTCITCMHETTWHTLFLMFFALLAYIRVLSVSMKSLSLGLMQAIISVRLYVRAQEM